MAADRVAVHGEEKPTKYWLSTLPEDAFAPLVDLTMLRWRIERDYQELKQELGLGHYEGRAHHHASLCIVAYGFLLAERARIPPRDRLAPESASASSTRGLSTPRHHRSGPSGTCQTRSRRCADV